MTKNNERNAIDHRGTMRAIESERRDSRGRSLNWTRESERKERERKGNSFDCGTSTAHRHINWRYCCMSDNVLGVSQFRTISHRLENARDNGD